MEKEHKKDRQYGLYFEAGLVQAKGNQAFEPPSGIVPGKIMSTRAALPLF